MINVMVDHDKAGAMKKWVNGVINSWLVRILENVQEKRGNISGLDNLTEDARKLIVRAVLDISQPDQRSIVLSTCLHHGIIQMFHIPTSELNNVTVIGLD